MKKQGRPVLTGPGATRINGSILTSEGYKKYKGGLDSRVESWEPEYYEIKSNDPPMGPLRNQLNKTPKDWAGFDVNSALNKHFKEVGATMSKEWASRAGARGQAVLAAY